MLFHVIPPSALNNKFQEHPLATGITSHPRVPGATEELFSVNISEQEEADKT